MDEFRIEPITMGGRATAPADNGWAHRPLRPAWWRTAEDHDRQADQADEAARLRDHAATDRDAAAARRDDDAVSREQDAAGWLVAAQRRLMAADIRDADLWAASIGDVDSARAAHTAAGTEASRVALLEAEAECEARTGLLIRSGIERQAVREDLDHIAQHLAASAADRRAAATDRARSQLDRHAAADDRGLAHASRLQAGVDRSGDWG